MSKPKTSVPKGTPKRGYILHETADIVVIATLKTKNRKTGSMVQIWSLTRNEKPSTAVKTGLDALICFGCVHRGIPGVRKRTCYVTVVQAPNGIWKAYNRGVYPYLDPADYASVFTGLAVRFGAYGESVLLPIDKMRAIAAVARKHTGYTHRWRELDCAPYRDFVMASCDSARDYADATAAGWRTFRVRGEFEPLEPREIVCPASDEGNHKSECAKCGLCDGARAVDQRKNIAIIVHGVGAKNFVPLGAIAPAAPRQPELIQILPLAA